MIILVKQNHIAIYQRNKFISKYLYNWNSYEVKEDNSFTDGKHVLDYTKKPPLPVVRSWRTNTVLHLLKLWCWTNVGPTSARQQWHVVNNSNHYPTMVFYLGMRVWFCVFTRVQFITSIWPNTHSKKNLHRLLYIAKAITITM